MSFPLEITQERFGRLAISNIVPDLLQPSLNALFQPLFCRGNAFTGLMQVFSGKGFSIWYSTYHVTKPARVSAMGNVPLLELHISRKKSIKGSWEKQLDPVTPEWFFRIGAIPYVDTLAEFEEPANYETFDLILDYQFLATLGYTFKSMMMFLDKVNKNEPADLTMRPQPCTRNMKLAIENILYNEYSPAGKVHAIESHVMLIVIEAMEMIAKENSRSEWSISETHIEALHYARQLIHQAMPDYPGNDALVRFCQPALNSKILLRGFRELFGFSPYEYYLNQRLEFAKQLMEEGIGVAQTAFQLGYQSPISLIKAFKKAFHCTPGKWEKQ